MGRQAWTVIKQSKLFYVRTFRRANIMLLISLMLNLLLIVGIYYMYFDLPAREFYAANGITQPVKLKPMLKPNNSSKALLAPDPDITEAPKKIPQ